MKTLSKLYVALIIFFLYAPVFVMIAFSFNASSSVWVFKGFSFEWYTSLISNTEMLGALKHTLIIAVLSATISTVLGTAAAVGIMALRKKITQKLIMSVTNIPMMNADIVTGISLMLLFIFFGRLIGLEESLGFITVLVAHITFNLPYVILSVMPKLKQTDKNLQEAALDLGCTPLQAFFKVVIPSISTGIITGFIMTFTLSLDDFVISYFTCGHYQTLPIVIYNMTKKSVTPDTYALSTIIFIAIFVLLVFYNMLQTKAEKKQAAAKNRFKGGSKMKKFLCLLLSLCLVLSFSGCGYEYFDLDLEGTYTKDLAGTTLTVYNWGEYIADGNYGLMDVNKEFEKLTGIKVNYLTFESNETMYSQVKNGGVNYDIAIPSDYMVERMIKENMLSTIDTSKLKNYHYIDEQYKNTPFDPENKYSVPYNVGMVGIIYNSKYIKNIEPSWNVLWNPQYKDMVLNFNNPRDAFLTAQILLGQNVNTSNKSEWDKAAKKLIEGKDNLQAYVMDEVYGKMETGEAYIAPYYAGDYLTMLETNPDLKFFYPEEGTNIFIDSACILKNAKNKEAAMLYLDFLLEPQVALANAEYICYASPNTAVINNPDYCYYQNDILYPDKSKYEKAQYYRNIDEDIRRYYENLWIDVKLS